MNGEESRRLFCRVQFTWMQFSHLAGESLYVGDASLEVGVV